MLPRSLPPFGCYGRLTHFGTSRVSVKDRLINASAIEVAKFANFLNLMMTTATNGAVLTSDIQILKQNFKTCCTSPGGACEVEPCSLAAVF